MKKALLLCAFLAGCSSKAETPVAVPSSAPAPRQLPTVEAPPAQMTEDVTLDFTVETGDGKPLIQGVTNLPPGTKLSASVSDVKTGGGVYPGQSSCIVADGGTFRVGPFSKKGAPLVGEFSAGVTMPIPKVQPPEVQAIIGENGQHLRGPLLEPAGIVPNQVVVSVEKNFVVGGPDAVAQQDKSLADDLERGRELYREVEKLGSEVKAARNRRFTYAEWGRFIRSFNTRIDSLQNRIDQLERPARFNLGVAAGDLQMLALDLPRVVLDGKPAKYDPRIFEEDLALAKSAIDALAQ